MRSSIPAFVICLVALVGAARPAAAQTSWSVSTASELSAALAGAFANNVANPSVVNTITLTGTISSSSQWIVNANVNIVGNGSTIDMQNADRAFFIAGGAVGISGLTIQNGRAVGGNGGLGAGGGAGLGGGIFIGSGTYQGWTTTDSIQPIVSALGISAPAVTLTNVAFQDNRAVGGNGGAGSTGPQAGGGGGMGGNGGNATQAEGIQGGGGGGGFGNGAYGGSNNNGSGNGSEPGAAGAFINVISGSNGTSAGSGGNGGGTGGINGGGAGSGALTTGIGSGGGGGVGGGRGYFQDGTPPDVGGFGGFGGGGGGNYLYYAGPGGFGGGGGAASGYNGGDGGFGGGGGNRYSTGSDAADSSGGFGGGNGSYAGPAGGAGMGAGGGVFAMAGATLTVTDGVFSGNTVTGGIGGNNGSAYGADLFLGANVAFSVSAGQTVSVASLGGAGNLSDPNVAGRASDPNAQGGLVKTGPGTLTLTGTSYYVGATTVNSGTLALGAGAKEQGTALVTVGQNAGDDATLVLGGSSFLALGGWNFGNPAASTDQPVMIAAGAGSTGAVRIGAGAGSSGADIAARVFSGGAGTASLTFTQQYAAGSTTNPVYPFYTTLTGTLALVQNGLGTTALEPSYGPNTFVGPVTVNSGTLLTTGTVAALAGVTSIAINGGAFALGQIDGITNLANVTLSGGALAAAINLTQNFGTLTVASGTSVIDFSTHAATFNFATLSLAPSSQLAIWNYAGADDVLRIATGTATGSLAQIAFYSDSGTTYLGEGGFVGTTIVPVPEPATIVMAFAGFVGLAASRWIFRKHF